MNEVRFTGLDPDSEKGISYTEFCKIVCSEESMKMIQEETNKEITKTILEVANRKKINE